MDKILYKNLSYKIIGLAMKIHRELGDGFLEKVYENSLMLLLEKENIKAEQQTPIKVFYKNKLVGKYFSDILVNDEIILELKTVKNISKKHKAQMINYLNATKK
ncbi:MAG: GxxExxY protein, partial [Candidatus Mcinerneyibacterium aminivorans]